MIQSLLENAATLLVSSLLLAFYWRDHASRSEPGYWHLGLIAGACFGAAAVFGMMNPVQLAPGLFFDARSVALSMAGLFAGPVAAVLAGLMAGAYRLYVGGAGVWAGLLAILLPTLLGLAYHALQQRGKASIGPWQLLGFGLILQASNFLAFLVLPAPLLRRTLEEIGIALVVIIPTATVVLGLLLRDLLQRSRSANDLRISEARFRALTAASPDLLLMLDEDGRYLEIVAPDESLLVEPIDQLLGRRVRDTLPDTEARRIEALIKHTLSSGDTEIIEYSLRTPAGLKVFEGHAKRIDHPLDNKRVIAFLAREITDRINSELERRIAAIAFESQQGMVITDADTRILKVNKAFCDITGYSAEEVLGQTTRLLRSGRHPQSFFKQMWSTIAEKGSWEGEIWNRRKNGDTFPEWLTISAVRDPDGTVTHYVGALTDITERKAAQDQIHHLAFYDPLTKIPNRRLLFDRLQQALMGSSRSRRFGALMLFDLDNFKNVNDLHGHQVGDALLCEVARRLAEQMRTTDTFARVGGDEFAIVLEDFKGDAEEGAALAKHIGERILSSLASPYHIGKTLLHSTASMGVVMFEDASVAVDEMIRRADIALYEAKQAGRNTLRFFDTEMQEAVGARLRLVEDVRRGLDQWEFVLYLQPQVDADGGLVGAEALVRWQHPEHGIQTPDRFIGIAERSGLIQRLDIQVLELACHQLARWASQPHTRELSLAVNISAPLLYQPQLVDNIQALLQRSGADPRRIKLELTESLLLDDMNAASERMNALRALGLRFSLDDFGTGYSSMAYLHQLPLDQIKIDRSFTMALDEQSSPAIVRAICSLGPSLGIEVLAEGVETQSQRDFLEQSGCRLYQGYLYGRPMSEAAFEQYATHWFSSRKDALPPA